MDEIKRDENGYIVSEEKQALLDAMHILRVRFSLVETGSAKDYLVNAFWHLEERTGRLPVEI